MLLMVVRGNGSLPRCIMPRSAAGFPGYEPQVQNQNACRERDGLTKSHDGSLSQAKLKEQYEHKHQDGGENEHDRMNTLARAPHGEKHEKNQRKSEDI